MKWVPVILMGILMMGCATNQAMVMPNKDFRQYKTAYVEILKVDEFNLGPSIIQEMGSLGIEVINNPSSVDMKVSYSYTRGWDLGGYLKSFQITFIDAKDDSIIASSANRLNGNWRTAQGRIKAAFKKLRKKLTESET